MNEKFYCSFLVNFVVLFCFGSIFYACSGNAVLSKRSSSNDERGELLVKVNLVGDSGKYLSWTRSESDVNYPIDDLTFSVSLYYNRGADYESDIDVVLFSNIPASQFEDGYSFSELEPWEDVSVVVYGRYMNDDVYYGQGLINIVADQRSELTILLNEINVEEGGSGVLESPISLTQENLLIDLNINNNPIISSWFVEFGDMNVDPTSVVINDINSVRILSFTDTVTLSGDLTANDPDSDRIYFSTFIGYYNQEATSEIFCNPMLDTDNPSVNVSSLAPQAFNCVFTNQQFENVTSFRMMIEDERGGSVETNIDITSSI